MYKIEPYQGFNEIRFGYESDEIERLMRVKPRKFKKSPYDVSNTDEYYDFFVYYDEKGRSEAIEFNSNAYLIYKDIIFFELKYIDVETIFRSIDPDIEVDEVGFNSNKFGIGVYSSNKDDINAEIESVIIFKKGYYD